MISLWRKISFPFFVVFTSFVLASCVPSPESQGGDASPAFESSGGSSRDFSSPGENSKSAVSMAFQETTANPTNTSSFSLIISFSDTVEGFSKWDIDVDNGRVSEFTSGGDIYFMKIEAFGHGSVGLDVKEDALSDRSISNNVPLQDHSLTNDIRGPEGTFTPPGGTPTTFTPTTIALDFDENVTGLEDSDFTVGNGTIHDVIGAGDSYLINVQALSSGTVSVTLNASSVKDSVGNNNTTTPSLNFSATDNPNDTQPPYLSLTSSDSSPTTSDPISYTATFTENVTGLTEDDIQVTNGSVSGGSLSGGPDTYTFTVNPTAQGDVNVTIPEGAVEDGAGNENLSDSLEMFYDESNIVAELALMDIEDGSTVNRGQSVVKLTFNEDVTGVEDTDFTVNNGTIKNLKGSRDEYTFDLEASGASPINVDVTFDATSATDTNGNNNSNASSSNTVGWTHDDGQPSLTISATNTTPTATSPIPIEADFGESVTGFTAGDITVENGNVDGSSFSGSGDSYSFDVVPANQGTVDISIPLGAGKDSLGNPSSPDSFSLIYDTSRPNVSLEWADWVDSFENDSPIELIVVFDEPVTGLTKGDFDVTNIDVTNSTLVSTAEGDAYRFDIVPQGDGSIDVSLPADADDGSAVLDRADKGNNASTGPSLSVTVDTTPPSLDTFEWAAGVTTPYEDGTPMDVDIVFSETVTGLTKDDFNYTNVNVQSTSLSGSGDTYTLSVEPDSEGLVEVTLPSGTVEDLAGNNNTTSSTTLDVNYDPTAPNASLSWDTSVKNYESTTPLTLDIEFSESVSGLQKSDFNFSNVDSAASTLSGSGDTYTLDVEPNSEGEVTVELPEDSVEDDAGNGNNPSNTVSVNYEPTFLLHLGDSSAPNDASDKEFCTGVVVDSLESPYCFGFTYGDLFQASNGGVDPFVMKTSPSGAIQWTLQFGGGEDSWCDDGAIDDMGNLICAGRTTGSLGENNGGGGNYDALITKISPNGSILWTTQLGDATEINDNSGADRCQSVDVDSDGNIYCVGTTTGDFGSFAGTNETNAGNKDAFVLKLNSSGALQWITQLGNQAVSNSSEIYDASSDDSPEGVVVDDSGNVFVSGYTQGSLGETNGGGVDIFLMRLNSAGELQWLTQLGDSTVGNGASSADKCLGVDLDDGGDIHCTGYTSGDLAESNSGIADIVVIKLSASGSLRRITQIGQDTVSDSSLVNDASGGDWARTIEIDDSDNVYISGRTNGDLVETSAGSSDVFAGKLNSAGEIQWLTQLGSSTSYNDNSSFDECRSLALDGDGGLYCGGITNSDFNETNPGNDDTFLLKMTISGDVL